MALFDNAVLLALDWSKAQCTYSPSISLSEPGEGYKVRCLEITDYDKGYLDLLTNLTLVGELTKEAFELQFRKMQASGMYYIVVVEDISTCTVVATSTLLVEHKFIHCAANRARIEDVVVSPHHQGKQLGKLLLDTMVLLAQQLNCYKISLDCNEQMQGFYTKFNLKLDTGHRFMVHKFFD